MTPVLADRLRGRRVGVALSSAFFGFYAHTGFLRALRTAGVRPAGYSGSSAGALAAAFAAADALDGLADLLPRLKRADFWDPALPTTRPMGLLRGQRFAAILDTHLPVADFESCATPLVTVATDLTRGVRHVDTTGPLVPAVLASCALPVLFRPVARHGGLHADGGIVDKIPLRALAEAVDVDVVVAHLLPSHGLSQPLPRSPMGLLDRALDVARDDGWRHQVELLRARGVEVHVVETKPTRITPFTMKRGAQAVARAEAATTAALRAPVSTG